MRIVSIIAIYIVSVMLCAFTLRGQSLLYRFHPHFERLTIDEGLSQSSIFAMRQDRHGFVWFCTQDGLNRFDGYKFTVFRNHPEDSLSLAVNWINDIYEAPSGRLWAITRSTANLFLPHSEKFRVFLCTLPNASNKAVSISSVVEDTDGILWMGTDNGLFFANATQGLTRHVVLTGKDTTLSIYALARDSAGAIFVGTSKGLFLKKRSEQGFTRFEGMANTAVHALTVAPNGTVWCATDNGISGLQANSYALLKQFSASKLFHTSSLVPTSLHRDSRGILWCLLTGGVLALDENSHVETPTKHVFMAPTDFAGTTIFAWSEDAEGRVWIGTNNGVNILLGRTNTGFPTLFSHLTNHFDDPKSLSNNIVRSFLQDRSGTVWIGTDNGINSWNPIRYKFTAIGSQTSPGFAAVSHNKTPKSTANTSIRAFLDNSDSTMWVGTDDGVNLFDRRTGLWRRFGKDEGLLNTDVRVLARDVNGKMIVGTNGGGLFTFDGKRFSQETYNPHDSSSLNSNRLRALYLDRKGTLWAGLYAAQGVATSGITGGIALKRAGTKVWERIINNGREYAPSRNEVRCFFSDDGENMWVGTHGGGLDYFNVTKRTVERFSHNANDSTSISSNIITCIVRSKAGVLWVATASGLNKYLPRTRTFQRFTVRNGLPNDFIYGVLEDAAGNLWLSTNKGLSCFSPNSATFRNYDRKDGLPSNEFNSGAFYRFPSGEMLFGGNNGFVIFPPNNVPDSKYEPPVQITAIKVLNKERLFDKPLAELESISLSYKENFLAFEFSALDYVIPERNKYTYKLDGVDKDWVMVSSDRRYAAYSDLDAGEYIFRVRATNSDGIWAQNERILRVRIIPPFWQTWWFRALMILAGMMSLWAAYRGRVSFIQRRNKVLERLVSDRTKELEITNQELNVVNDEVLRQNHILEEQTAQIEITNTELQQKNIELGILNEQLEDYTEEMERYSAKLEEQAKLIEQKNSELQEKNNELAIVNEQLEDYSEEMERYSAKLEAQAREITLASTQIQEQNHALQDLNVRKNELIGVVAHDLKNPLSGILMSSSLMLRYYDKMTKDDILQNIQRIKETGERMNKIILDLLDIEAIESGKFNLTLDDVEIDEIVRATANDYKEAAERKHISLLLESAPNLTQAKVDKHALRQILDNLVSNAIKYSPHDRRVWLTTRESKSCTESSTSMIEIEVRDEGPGLSVEDQSKLFGRFAKLTPQPTGGEHSTGLGLSIVKQLAEAMGGQVVCTSELGVGTTFTVRVMAAET